MIAVLLPAAGIEPTLRYHRTFLRRQPYTTRVSKYLSNSISTSIPEWYKAIVVRMSFGTVTWVRFPQPVKGLRSKRDFVEMEYPVHNVAAFKSPPMILRCPSDFFYSAWMWMFTLLWRSGRLAVAWWMLIMWIRSALCCITSSHKTCPRAMCSSTLFSRGLCQFTTSALRGNTRLCRKVTTVICTIPSLYLSLGTWSPSVSATKSILLPAAM